jgi:hypothetical protein
MAAVGYDASRELSEKQKRPVVWTGRGVQRTGRIDQCFIRSHANGLGPKDVDVVRVMMDRGGDHGAERNGAVNTASMRMPV